MKIIAKEHGMMFAASSKTHVEKKGFKKTKKVIKNNATEAMVLNTDNLPVKILAKPEHEK